MTKRAPLESEITPRLRAAFHRVSDEELRRAIPISLLCVDRLAGIGECLRQTAFVPGDTAEVGAAGGGTSRLIALANRGKRHWVCDTFEGLVDCGPHDGPLRNGMFSRRGEGAEAAHARVRRLLEGQNVETVAGKFPESAPGEMRAAAFAFVHLDVDTYESMKASFEFFSRRMAPGGIVALDDAVSGGAIGAQKFWRELVEGRRSGAWERFGQNRQQALVRFH